MIWLEKQDWKAKERSGIEAFENESMSCIVLTIKAHQRTSAAEVALNQVDRITQ